MNGYLPFMGRFRNASTCRSNSLQASDTVDLEKAFPHSVSITFPTFRLDVPFTTISAIVVINAPSLRL